MLSGSFLLLDNFPKKLKIYLICNLKRIGGTFLTFLVGSLGYHWAFSSVQSLSHVGLFAAPWTAACQASLSITNSQSISTHTHTQTHKILKHELIYKHTSLHLLTTLQGYHPLIQYILLIITFKAFYFQPQLELLHFENFYPAEKILLLITCD